MQCRRRRFHEGRDGWHGSSGYAWPPRDVNRLAFPEPLERLVQSLERLPGIGPRSAERIALHVLRSSTDEVAELALALRDARMQTQR